MSLLLSILSEKFSHTLFEFVLKRRQIKTLTTKSKWMFSLYETKSSERTCVVEALKAVVSESVVHQSPSGSRRGEKPGIAQDLPDRRANQHFSRLNRNIDLNSWFKKVILFIVRDNI